VDRWLYIDKLEQNTGGTSTINGKPQLSMTHLFGTADVDSSGNLAKIKQVISNTSGDCIMSQAGAT